MFSKLKALVGLEKFYRFKYSAKSHNSKFSLPSMVPCAKVKVQVIVFGYRTKSDIWELGIVTSKHPCVIEKFRLIIFVLYMKAITQVSPEFSELSLWPNTQSFDIWSIPPRLEVLPLTQNYQTEQKNFGSKMIDRCLHLYIVSK